MTKTTGKMALTFNRAIYSELLSKHHPRIIKSEEENIEEEYIRQNTSVRINQSGIHSKQDLRPLNLKFSGGLKPGYSSAFSVRILGFILTTDACILFDKNSGGEGSNSRSIE